ncbi:hypothetical protein BJF92_00705 [Rhizobium rhizosphaerae]|uniref:Uncharacterized protein n=1 Tax=Xaviernesmea rhizosphaerae TaxID=1672749 RepID=A0A1Q9AEK2_9HYPH|nr:hypothetical protein [Xaviernesmea rhizosphaerae]OLP53321.1 hypothetical protein BJF92_00705 [Xaviernesmea rhizosphaerae]
MTGSRAMFSRHPLAQGSLYVSCDDGWLPVIDDCLTRLESFGVPIEIRRIREKMGCLQMSIVAPTTLPTENKIRWADIIRAAEETALKTCEVCGAPGRLRVSETGTYATRCDLHEVI